MRRGRGDRVAPIPVDDDPGGAVLYLPEPVVAETERLLRTYGGGEAHEGIVYLGGVEVADRAVALAALSPAAETTWGSFRTELAANTAVVQALDRLRLVLVGQIHSHPGTWVDHSDGDDEGALVRFEGYWSLVVPVFAREGMRPLERCGVHRFQRGRFARLTVAAVGARVHVVPPSVDLRGRPQ